MKKDKMKKALSLAMIVLSACSATSACVADSNPTKASESAYARFSKGTNKVYRRESIYKTSQSAEKEAKSEAPGENEARAKDIAESVESLSSIKSASVVITGNVAIVGVAVEDGFSDLQAIKDEVTDAAKQADENIDQVRVTTDESLIARIKGMSDSSGAFSPRKPRS
ncbi:MAG: YhcN/YlaJ family sporulation lipoprotein [Clostridiales bacterium]|nr:YhcN/YlaJ family sporulation lipoprotein [Clostridiales bacterium]